VRCVGFVKVCNAIVANTWLLGPLRLNSVYIDFQQSRAKSLLVSKSTAVNDAKQNRPDSTSDAFDHSGLNSTIYYIQRKRQQHSTTEHMSEAWAERKTERSGP